MEPYILRVGLTGGIGSGKSTIAAIFEVLGIPVAYADMEAKRVMNEDAELRQQVITHFGPEAYGMPARVDAHGDGGTAEAGGGDVLSGAGRGDGGAAEAGGAGSLNRAWLAAQVFSDPAKLELLNSLVHPATIREGEKWMKAMAGRAPYAIREAALIFETRAVAYFDFIIGVHAPQALRIHRTMQRDGSTKDDVMQRMRNQIDEDIKMRLCDAVIVNDETQAVLPQILALHERLAGLASPTST